MSASPSTISTVSNSEGSGEPNPEPAKASEPKSDPLLDCTHCHDIVRDEWTRRPGRIENPGGIQTEREWQWSASRLFHDPCDSCSAVESPSTLLCQFCQHLRLRHLSLCAPYEHLPKNVPIPKPKPDSTCPLCLFFRRISLREHIKQRISWPLSYPLYISATAWRQQREQVQWRVTGSDRWGTPAEFLVVQDSDMPLPVLDAALPDMTILKDCISHCVENHDFCKSTNSMELPSDFRLVDIENQCIVSTPVENCPDYVALSYVWGTASATDLTTKFNIAERLEMLDFSTLPVAIRDAGKACERLGERYIWIDRLCIVQDDDIDKTRQIEAMCAIYSAAKLVLVHASGESIDDGIPGISQERKPQISQELCNLKINVQLPPLWDVVGNSTWNSRGWTYQEAILPNRKVFFTYAQIFFECAARINHEETLAYSSFDRSMHDKNKYPTTTTSLSYGAAEASADKLGRTRLRYRTTETSWEAYRRHVPRYRQRRLQEASDLVNAFSGVLGALYPGASPSLHGLPLDDLDIALLWRALNNDDWVPTTKKAKKPLAHRSEPSCFPSWSWASAPDIVPDYSRVEEGFCGGLCVWFRRASTKSGIQPVIATGNATSAWKADDKPRSSIFMEVMSTSDVRYSLSRVLMGGMIESPVSADAALWGNMRSDELEDELRRRWPSYHAFWQDVHGREEALQLAQERFEKDRLVDVQSEVLLTRAQVAKVRIMEVQETYTWARMEKIRTIIGLFSMKGVKIGTLVHDHNDQVSRRLKNGDSIFECMALSVSAKRHFDEEPLTEDDIKESFVGDDTRRERYRLECWINTLIICRRDGFCYRVGLAQIPVKHWLEGNAAFETITLI